MEYVDMKGKTAVIVGATRGIGEAIALRMAKLGMNVAALARKEEELAALKEKIEAFGVKCLTIQADITDYYGLGAAY